MVTLEATGPNGHECEWVSTCCGAGEDEYVENFCTQCHEFSSFWCPICEEERAEL